MTIVSALIWVPDFARGNVRDMRVRWMLEELGVSYQARLLDHPTRQTPAYRAEQPFGQVPAIEIDGRTMFESGAIVLSLAQRHGALLGRDDAERERVLSWYFAALNSVEPALMNLAEVDVFMTDEAQKAQRRPSVVAFIEQRLRAVENALGDHDHLAGEFSIADLMMSSVMRVIGHTDILERYPAIACLKARCEARPAFQRAHAAQCADIDAHVAADVRYPSA